MNKGTRSTHCALIAALWLCASGCVTGHMWHAMTTGGPGRIGTDDGPGTPSPWADYIVAALLAPLTLPFDVVLFPFQLGGGYWPYGDKSKP